MSDSLLTIIVLAATALIAWLYAKALRMASAGELIVYRDWKDFLLSSAWYIAMPLSCMWLFDSSGDIILKALGCLSLALGVGSLGLMVAGGIRYNTGMRCWLSVFSRIAVTLLSWFAIAKLKDCFDRYKKGENSIVQGVVIPLLVAGAVFNWLVCPMLGQRKN